ncbi:MAG: ATP-dependent DNA helicase RecG [Lachnospiraceae bacterium]|nr:ATP-dependent DNA helicase RecG [Lachnospiraceae bacterium]
MLYLSDPITRLSGVGEKTALLFQKQNIVTINDLLHHFPRDYRRIPEILPICDLQEKSLVVVRGKIVSSPSIFSRNKRTFLSFDVKDATGTVGVTFFGMPYLKKTMVPGKELLLYGVVRKLGVKFVFDQPKVLKADEYEEMKNCLWPVYPLTDGLGNEKVRKAVRACYDCFSEMKDYLSEKNRKNLGLLNVSDALYKMHFPKEMEEVYDARKRLAFDEFVFFLLKLEKLKEGNEKKESQFVVDFAGEEICEAKKSFLKGLSFALTAAQTKVLEEIERDLSSGYQMNRLVQGDVGCGKTVLAFLSALYLIKSGYQVALMAPTEVLASQHYEDIIKMESSRGLGIHAALLSGSVKTTEKKKIYSEIESGAVNLIIGTHALIQEKVNYHKLALVITDEQHRFGVKQRSALMEKGEMVHVLVMSATPIPRTLALVLYGDLDVSVVDELPAKRMPIKNSVLGPDYREKMYQFIAKRIAEGRQAYVICPMVEEGDLDGVENVTDYTDKLKEIYRDYAKIACLHGKMKPAEKEKIMQDFKEHRTDILVSTTVVEVGVNVPNATVMMIENAERFGLAQLHQLRGRVGRGEHQSYAVFMLGNDGKKAKERLEILNRSNDGFEIASEDLKQRGPGDFFGLRQSGLPGFKIADIFTDAKILLMAKEYVENELQFRTFEEFYSLFEKENASLVDFHAICL